MNDYIKREDVLSAFKNAISDVFEYDTYDELLLDEGISRERCQKIISNIPTSDVQEVRHGYWINHFDDLFPNDNMIECSVCHELQIVGNDDNYCPNCGAIMDLEG